MTRECSTDDERRATASTPARVSLIICTRNRGSKLQACLDAVARIDHSEPWEVILVDNGSTDDTASILNAFVAANPGHARYVFERRPGLARARNAGLRAASGDVMLFTDDDCYVSPDIITSCVEAFSHPAIGFLGGRIWLFDKTDAPVTILESPDPKRFPAMSYVRAGEVQGACMAFRREVLGQIGGFDPLFGSGAYFPAEDIDAVARASLAGWAGVYDPAVAVFHHHGRKPSDLPGLLKDYDRGRGAYQMKLLLRHGRLRWFLRGVRSNLRRLPRTPGGAMQEFVGSLEYAWRYFLNLGQR